MYKQIIIVRKDLKMSIGKICSQVSHGSMAFLTWMIRNNINPQVRPLQRLFNGTGDYETHPLTIDKDFYEQWIDGEFTKCVLQSRNKTHLLKAKTMAEELGLKENIDFFCIYDNCKTELEPEEDGKTLTVIGFRPMDSQIIDKIGRKYHLYMDANNQIDRILEWCKDNSIIDYDEIFTDNGDSIISLRELEKYLTKVRK